MPLLLSTKAFELVDVYRLAAESSLATFICVRPLRWRPAEDCGEGFAVEPIC